MLSILMGFSVLITGQMPALADEPPELSITDYYDAEQYEPYYAPLSTEPMPDFEELFPLFGLGSPEEWLIPDWPEADMRNGFAGSNFGTGDVWDFTGEDTGNNRRETLSETVAGVQNNFMQWFLQGQSGSRSISRALSEPLQGSNVFVTFDYRPGTVNQGGTQPALNLEFSYGADPLMSITVGTGTVGTGAAARRIGAFAGCAATGSFMNISYNNQVYQQENYVDFPEIRALGTAGAAAWWLRWYTFGILFDFDNQVAYIKATERGQDELIVDVAVPFEGTALTGVVWNAPRRPAGVNLNYTGNGLDNLFFFMQDHSPDTVIQVIPPEFLGRPTEPTDADPRANFWQNWFISADSSATVESLGLPTTIDVRTAVGDTVVTQVTWRVTDMPWTTIANRPASSDLVFDSSIPGVFTFTGTIADVPGEAYNRMMLAPQIHVEVREGLLHDYARPVEWLDRGVTAVPVHGGGGILVHWRMLVTEYALSPAMQFRVYRGNVRLATTSATNFVDVDGSPGDTYWVVPVGVDRTHISAGSTVALENNFLEIPVQRPSSRLNPALQFEGTLNYPSVANPYRYIHYIINDMSVADVDGDGQYEILVRWTTNMQRDPGLLSPTRHTGETIFDLYTLEGDLIWRINMGVNIVSSEHHHVMNFFDLDNDGFAEFAIKTAEGTRVYHPDPETGLVLETVDGGTPVYIIGGDGVNNFVGDFNYDELLDRSRGFYVGTWVSHPNNVWTGGTRCPVRQVNNTGAGAPVLGRINNGPEFFTVFDGQTGLPIDTVEYFAPYGIRRGTWGDTSQNRSDRFGGTVAFMPRNGVTGAEPWPTVIEIRQHYGPHHVAAYQLIDGRITMIWDFDFRLWGAGNNNANHQVTVADVTFNGYDDVIFGSMVLDYRGNVLWNADTTRGTLIAEHGDSMHMAPIFPGSPEFYRFVSHENGPPNNVTLFHASTGRPVWTFDSPEGDVDRANLGNIVPLPGFEAWASSTTVTNIYTGNLIHVVGGFPPDSERSHQDYIIPINHLVYWTGSLNRQFLDGPSDTRALSISELYNFNFSLEDYHSGNLPERLEAERRIIQTFTGTSSNNGWKSNPGLQADIFGDWREEVIVRRTDNEAIRIYITDHPTDYTIYTLMHDPAYRVAVSWQNNIYNQPPHLNFYLGPAVREDVLARNLPFVATRFTAQPTVEFNGTSPNALQRLLEDYNAVLSTRGNLGIFANHSPFVIPAGRTLTVTTTLNISGNAELIVEGTLIVAEGGRINNQGSAGGTIRVATEGNLVNNGWVENVTNSTFENNGTITNNGRFEVRAGVTFYDQGTVTGTPLNINRYATVIS